MTRLDPVLNLIDIACAIRDAALDRIRGPKCPTCWTRTRNLPAHIAIDHAEVRG